MDREAQNQSKRGQASPALYRSHQKWAMQRPEGEEEQVRVHHTSPQWKVMLLGDGGQGRQEAESGRSLRRRTGRDGVARSLEEADASSERKYKINPEQENSRPRANLAIGRQTTHGTFKMEWAGEFAGTGRRRPRSHTNPQEGTAHQRT